MGRTFHLGDILTVTTGRLLSNMDGLYDLLNYMTGDDLMTHQLPRACDECAPALLAQHPDLADVPVPAEFDGKPHVDRWLAEQVARFGAARDVEPLAPEDHTPIHPLTELLMMAPGKPVIVVQPPSEHQDGAS